MKTFVIAIALALASIATAQASTHTVPVELQGSWCAARTVGPNGQLPNGFDKRVTLYNMTAGTSYDDVNCDNDWLVINQNGYIASSRASAESPNPP
jgi:hypothetical protein